MFTAAPVLSPATTGSAFSIFLSRVSASLWLLLRFVFPPFSFRSPGDLSVTAVGFVNERSSGGLPCRVVVVKSDARFVCCATVESGVVSVSGCVVILTGVVVGNGCFRGLPRFGLPALAAFDNKDNGTLAVLHSHASFHITLAI